MNNQQLGAHFEVLTKDFFVLLLKQVGFQITKERIQFNGSQNGFDILIMVSKNYIEHKIFIECKNYSSDLALGNILKKAWDLEKNYSLKENDLFIAINSKSNFKNEDNSEKSSPILNEKFPFTSYFLDISNGIKPLFAINNDFYKALYGMDVDFEVDIDKEIDRFKSIILSRKPFLKPDFTSEDKFKFIGSYDTIKSHIKRTLKEENEKGIIELLDSNKSIGLPEIITSNDKIFLIGNPGSGKSTELRVLAEKLWEQGPETGLIPIYKSLKNFTITDSLESYLPASFDDFNNIIFILDGIDEIADIEYFKSKLEVFIDKNENRNKSFKYIISCRTNVYESVVNTITGFQAFYLNDLTNYEIKMLLKSHCGNLIDKLNFGENIKDFLNTPFQVLILSEYINANRKLPNSTVELWDNYIKVRLSSDELEKLKKIKLNIHLINEYSKKLSLINELMKSNICSEDNIFKLVEKNNSNLEEFKKNPLLDCTTGTKDWFFEHRNIQEYFAAVAISEKSFKEILKFIQVEGTLKTHPSLFNTITFLINLLNKSSEKYTKLRDWIVLNEPELLFKADYERIPENIRKVVFRNYFEEQCLKKTHWISTNRTFEVSEIAKFGNTSSNLDYLIKIIKDQNNHRRAMISALDLLSYFSIPKKVTQKLKLMLLGFLKDSKQEPAIKAQVLSLIESQRFAFEDHNYLKEIFKIFEKETNKEINRRLLGLIVFYEEIDDFSDYIEEEFLRDRKIVPRAIDDNTIRGNSYVLNEIIFKLKSSHKFLSIAKHFFDITNNVRMEPNLEEKLLDRLLFFIKKEADFIIKLLGTINDNLTFHRNDKFLKELIKKSGEEKTVIEYLLKLYSFEEISYFLSNIVDSETIKQVQKHLVKNKISNDLVERFRNYMGNMNSRILAVDFHNRMESNGFKFKEKAFSQEDVIKWQEEVMAKTQHGFDLLFDKSKLLDELKKLFQENDNLIDLEKYESINRKWYEENGHGSIISPSLSIIGSIVYSNRRYSLDLDEVIKIMEDGYVRFKEIESTLKRNANNRWKFSIGEIQKEKIQLWISNRIKLINIEEIINLKETNRFSYGKDFEVLKTILYFWRELKLNLPKKFLLKCLKFCELEGNTERENSLEEFKVRIKDNKAFDKQIIENIKEDKLFSLVLYGHINYALENELTQVFPELIEHFKKDISIFNESNKIEKLYEVLATEKGKDYAVNILKEFCEDLNKRISWTVIKILVKNSECGNFCIEKALKYLKTGNNNFLPEALEILFIHNHKDAIQYLIKHIEIEPISNVRFISFGNYSAIKDFAVLPKLYEICYGFDQEAYESHLLRTFYNSYISNLSKTEESFIVVQEILLKIKEKLESKNTDLFYINMLIEDSRNSYVNSKSKAYSFPEALKKVEELVI